VVGVENADLKLLPGMTASAEIEVSVRDNVLRIPNAALRFKPPAALRPARTETRDGLLEGLTLSAEQRAAYEADRQQMDQLSANERSQLSEQGLLPPGQSGQAMVIRLDAASAASPQAIQQAIAQRMRERFAGFRATLDEAQRAQFDARLATLGASAGDARPAPGGAEVWQPTDDGPRPRAVQIGVADSTHTELRDQRLREGDTVIVGVQRG
jgi:HlyD family secretion protein